MASIILAIAALAISILTAAFCWAVARRAHCAHGLADEALDAVALLSMSPDAVFLAEDGEEIEFRMDRGH